MRAGQLCPRSNCYGHEYGLVCGLASNVFSAAPAAPGHAHGCQENKCYTTDIKHVVPGHGRSITWTLRAKQAPTHIAETWVDTSWIVEVTSTGKRDGKPFQAQHMFLTSLRTTPEALLQLVRDRWGIENWHWISDTQLHEDAHSYRGNGAGAIVTLRTAAFNLLRLAGFRSILAGMQAVMHDITTLLAMLRRRPQPMLRVNQHWESTQGSFHSYAG